MPYARIFVFMIFVSGLFLPGLSSAEDKVNLVPLEPVPTAAEVTPYKVLPRRPGYNKRGWVDSVREDEIVINDTLRYITPSTQYYSSSNNSASKSILKPGLYVEFQLDRQNRIHKIRVKKK